MKGKLYTNPRAQGDILNLAKTATEFLVTDNKISASVTGVEAYVQSRGQNLVSNGTGLLGTNKNFSGFTFDGQQNYAGGGSFFTADQNAYKENDELIAVDPAMNYRFSLMAKSKTGLGRYYFGVSMFDIDGLSISPSMVFGSTRPVVTLAAELKAGDTTITLSSTDGIEDGVFSESSGHRHSIIFWGYKNSKGYTYPDGTYSRTYGNAMWNDGGVNRTTNVITLNKPWTLTNPNDPQGIFRVGQKVSGTKSGGSYQYITGSNVSVPTSWTKFEGTIGGAGVEATNFFPGTAFIRLIFLVNRSTSGGVAGDNIWLNSLDFANIKAEDNAKVYTNSVISQTKDEVNIRVSKTIMGMDDEDKRVLNFINKVGGSVTANPHVYKVGDSSSFTSPVNFTTERATASYNNVSTLDGVIDNKSNTINGAFAQQLFSFNLIEHVQRTYGTIPGTTTAEKVTWIRNNISRLTLNWWGFGSGPVGNRATLRRWDRLGSAWQDMARSHTNSTSTLLTSSGSSNYPQYITDDGFFHGLAYAEASNGTVASSISTDYVELEVVMKTSIAGDQLVSRINLQPGTIQIESKNINITGAVSFSSFDNEAKAMLASGESQVLNRNHNFYDWPAASAYPTGYTAQAGSPPTRVVSDNNTGYSAQSIVPASTNTYYAQTILNQGYTEYATIQVSFKLVSGTINGAGVLFRLNNTTNGILQDHNFRIADSIANPVLNKWYTITKIVKSTTDVNFGSYALYVMPAWSSLGTITAKTIQFDSVKVRPSTASEIQAFKAGATVDGWVSATNTTLIDGGKIQTDTIDVGALKAGTIDANKVSISSSTAGITINSAGVVANNTTTGVNVTMNSTTGFEIKKSGATVFTVDSTGTMYIKNVNIDGGTITWGTGTGKVTPPTAAQVGAAVAGDITTAINAVQVGARNLFKLSSFKDRKVGETVTMSPWSGNVANAYFSDDVPPNLSGRCLRINTTTEGTGGAYWDDDSVTIESGKTYTMSYYAKASTAASVNGYIVCLSRISDNAYITGPTINITTTWQRYSFTFTATAGQAGVYRRRHMVYQVNLYSIANVQLEEGNKLSAWSLNPDELVKDIDDVNVGGTNYVSGLGGTTYVLPSKLYSTDGNLASTQTINGKVWLKFTGSTTMRVNTIPIENNTTYTWSFTVYTLGTRTTLRTNQWGNGSYNTVDYTIGTTPVRLKTTFVSQGTSEILHILNMIAGDVYYFADFQLEKGNKATDWSQGISDLMTTADLVSGWKFPNKTTIGGNFIETNSITANKIAANTLTANEIAANTIATKNLLVTDFTNLIDNGTFEQDVVGEIPKGWHAAAGVANAKVVDISALLNGNGSAKAFGINAITTGNNDNYVDNIIDVKPGDEFYLEAEARYLNASGTGYGRLGFQLYDAKRVSQGSWKEVINWVAKTTSFSGGASPITDTSPKINTFVVPAGTYGIRVWASFSKSSETTNVFYIDNITVRRRNNANLIVDGAITADKINVNAVKGKTIELGSYPGIAEADMGNGKITVYDSTGRINFSSDESGTNINQLEVSGDLKMTGGSGRLYTDSYAERTSYTHPCWTGQKPADTTTEAGDGTTSGGDYNNGNLIIYVMGQSAKKNIDEARDGTRNRPFTSIQEAIDSVPKILDHNVTIKVFPFRYDENLDILGFTGTGTLEIKTVVWGIRKIIDVSNGSTSNSTDHWSKLYMYGEPLDTDLETPRDRRLRDHDIINPSFGSNSWTVTNVTTSNPLGVTLITNKRKMPTANYQYSDANNWYAQCVKSSTTPSNGEEFVAGKGYVRIDMGAEYDLAGIKVFKYSGGLRRDSNGRLIANNWRAYMDVQTWVSGTSTNGFDVDYTQGNLTSFNAANDGTGSYLSWGGFMKIWDNAWVPRDYYYETEFGHIRGAVIAGKVQIKGNSNYTVAMTNFHIDASVTTTTSAMDIYRNGAFIHISDTAFIQDPDGAYAQCKVQFSQARFDECEFTGCGTNTLDVNYFSDVMIDGMRGGDLWGGAYATIGGVAAIDGSTWSYTGDPAHDIKTNNIYLNEAGKDLATSGPNTLRTAYAFRKNTDMGTLFANPSSLLNQSIMDGNWNEDREIMAPPAIVTYNVSISSVSTIAKDAYATATVLVKNSNGAAVSGASVAFSSTNTTICKFGTGLTSTATVTTNSDGKATVRITNKNASTSNTYLKATITAAVGAPASKSVTKVITFTGPTKRLVTKVKTFTASYSESYHTGVGVWNGNYTGRDVIQGSWGGNSFKGCWFFGTTMYKACQSYKSISKVRVYVTRKSGGYNSGQSADIFWHKYTSKPSGSPTLYDTSSNTTNLAVGSSGWVQLSSTMVGKMETGEIKGFGLLGSSPYFRASGSLKVEVTYQVEEII